MVSYMYVHVLRLTGCICLGVKRGRVVGDRGEPSRLTLVLAFIVFDFPLDRFAVDLLSEG